MNSTCPKCGNTLVQDMEWLHGEYQGMMWVHSKNRSERCPEWDGKMPDGFELSGQ